MNPSSGVLMRVCRRGLHSNYCPLMRKPCSVTGQRLCSSSSTSSPSSWSSKFVSGLENYRRSLKWVPIPLSVGFAYICYQQYGHIKKRERRKALGIVNPEDYLASNWQVTYHLTACYGAVLRFGSNSPLSFKCLPCRQTGYGLYKNSFKL